MSLYPEEYYLFFIKFNEGDYYTCHDLLEEMWMVDKSNLFLKGLLQFTVALYHYSYGNVKGARIMMKAAVFYLNAYRPKNWGIDIEELLMYIQECLTLFPDEVDKVPFDEVDWLPTLPTIFLFLEE